MPEPLRILQILRAPVGGLFRHVFDLTESATHQLVADQLRALADQFEAGAIDLSYDEWHGPTVVTDPVSVTVDLKMDGDTVTDFAHDVKACALGQASSSIMARNVVGAKADELRTLRETVRKMLKENGEPPSSGRWADIAVLEPVRDYKARHASTLLTFDAVVDAINQIEAKRLKAAE